MLHVTARIKLLKTEEGGHTSCVRSGYRPNILFGDLYTDGALTFLDHQQVYPGDKCEVCNMRESGLRQSIPQGRCMLRDHGGTTEDWGGGDPLDP